MDWMAKLTKWLDRFEERQTEFRDVGARDTEPSYVWQHILWQAAQGLEYPADARTKQDWQLYVEFPDADKAAICLTAAAHCAHEFILEARDEAPAKVWRAMEQRLREYCWRI
jgi:hypothetical protein